MPRAQKTCGRVACLPFTATYVQWVLYVHTSYAPKIKNRIKTMASSKAARFNLRTTPEQQALIRKAAQVQRKSVSEFILESACRSAESALFEAKTLLLDRQGWKQLNEALKRDARAVPELVELFREKAPWD